MAAALPPTAPFQPVAQQAHPAERPAARPGGSPVADGIKEEIPLQPPSFRIERTLSIREAKIESSALSTDVVVKIHGTGVRASYLFPWQVKGQTSWTGTGFVIAGRRIMTNAHVVEDATLLQVTKQENPMKFRAKVVCIAHDLDLALAIVEDENFWVDLPHAKFVTELPDLYSEVKAVGFPVGGVTVCVTKGIVSRVDAQVYVHPRICGITPNSKNSPGCVTVLQIDAAINPGNSGGPTFDKDGRVIGVASSGLPHQQNVGYIIPAQIAEMFVAEFDGTGMWSGISELGLTVVALESESMRNFLKMGDEKGILVHKVAPLGALHGKIKPGDVITHIDGLDVTNEGDIPVVAAGQKIFLDMDTQVTKKAKGVVTTFRVLRSGQQLEVDAVLGPISPLAPRFHDYDSVPDYVIIGGIVFTRGSVPLQRDYLQARKSLGWPFISDAALWDHFDAYKEDPEHEIVALLTILRHDVNIGYNSDSVGVLHSLNERPVRNLAQLARLYGEAMSEGSTEEFLRFTVNVKPGEPPAIPDIVLQRSKLEAADSEICKTNQIPNIASVAMRPHFQRGRKEGARQPEGQ